MSKQPNIENSIDEKKQRAVQYDNEKLELAKRIVSEYDNEREYYSKIWYLFTDNVLSDEFKNTRRAALALIFVPTIVNIGLIFTPPSYFKTPLRISTIFACFYYFRYTYRQELTAQIKQDTPIGNKARFYFQNIAKSDDLIPFFGDQTLKIINEREAKTKQNNA